MHAFEQAVDPSEFSGTYTNTTNLSCTVTQTYMYTCCVGQIGF